MTNRDKGIRKPTRAAIAVEAVLLGVMAGVLAWLIDGRDGGFWSWAGIIGYSVVTLWCLISLIKLVRRRWTWAESKPGPEPVGYLDCDGDRWIVREDGDVEFQGVKDAVDVVEREFGPMTPVYACEECKGTGMSGRDPETNGRCWDCRGEGSSPL